MSAAAPDPSTMARLSKAAPHVAHDIRMLHDAWAHLGNSFAYTAWFVHCRSIMDFLDGRGSNPDDIRAKDFFDDPATWESVDSTVAKPATYEAYRTAVNKLAAHLTYERIQYADQDAFAPSRAIHDHLLGRCALFVRTLPAERLPWFAGLGI
jgi:hypothetical protein